jgi:hypothetical protein
MNIYRDSKRKKCKYYCKGSKKVCEKVKKAAEERNKMLFGGRLHKNREV